MNFLSHDHLEHQLNEEHGVTQIQLEVHNIGQFYQKKSWPRCLAWCSRPGHLQGLAVLLIVPCHHLEVDLGLAQNGKGGIRKTAAY